MSDSMNETNDRPELGTTEAAVRSCVNLIALATHTDEEHLAYWLDLYYQTRVAHERRASTPTFRGFIEIFGEPSRTLAHTEEEVKSPQPAARQVPHDVEAEEAEKPEPPAAQKKKKTGLR